MAAKHRKKKKKAKIRLELSWGGLAGLGVVSFCIFLWMFLFGIWAGQTVLQPQDFSDNGSLTKSLSTIWQTGMEGSASALQEPQDIAEEALQIDSSVGKEEWAKGSELSFFSLQVASFDAEDRARDFVLNWRAKGHEAFVLAPENGKDDHYWRVFVGKFEMLADANALAARFEEEESIRVYIALLPASKFSSS